MARVLIETQPWGIVQDLNGNALIGQSVHIANTDTSAATTWSAQTGGSSTTADQATGSNGAIPRWIEEGEYDVIVAGVTKRVEATAGSSIFNVPPPNGSDDTTAIQARIDAARDAGGGTVRLRNGIYKVSASLQLYDSVHLWGASANFRDTTKGATIQTTSAGALAGVPIINVNNTKFAGVHNLTLVAAGADPTTNTTLGISDFTDTTHQATFLTVEDCTFNYIGGVVIGLYGNVNYIFRNRADNLRGHYIHLKTSTTGPGVGSDNFVGFNASGFTSGNGEFGGGGAAGDGIVLEGGANNHVFGNDLYNCANGVHLIGAAYNRLEGNRCEKNDFNGILLDTASVGNTLIGNQLFNNGWISSKCGVAIQGASVRNQLVGNHIFNEATYPGGTNTDKGILLSGANSRNELRANVIYNMNLNGIVLDSESFSSACGNRIDTCGQQAIIVQNGSNDDAVEGNTIYKAGQATDNTYDAILIDANATGSNRTSVVANSIKHGGAANQPRTGIRINSASCNNTSVLDNDLSAAGRTSLTDNGTTSFIRHNRGFVTENGGLGTITSGTTSVVITHGLGFTPTVRDITITPTNNLGSAKVLFVSGSPTGTQFTVASDVDPGATTATFGWAGRRVLNN